MHSLFFRIFVLFWLAMALIVGSSIATTFTIAAREYEPPELQRRPSAAIQASEILARGGLGALQSWLSSNKNSMGDRDLFIVGPDGQDILGRHLPEGAQRRLEIINRDGFPKFPPIARGSQIILPRGSTYTVVSMPRRPSIFGALSLPAISLTILGIALVVSALLPAGGYSGAPHCAHSAHQECRRWPRKIDMRVSAGLEGRKDEARRARAHSTGWRIGCAQTRATTQLLRDISHELRSPLARMQVALGVGAPAAGRFSLQLAAGAEIERLDHMINARC